MQYSCPICQEKVSEELTSYMDHTESHIVDVIKEKHPDWVEEDGLCQKCLDYYRKEMKGE